MKAFANCTLTVNHDDVGADLARKHATKTQEALKCIDDEATVEASKCCGTRGGTADEQNYAAADRNYIRISTYIQHKYPMNHSVSTCCNHPKWCKIFCPSISTHPNICFPLSAFSRASPVSGEANARSLPGCELPVSRSRWCHMSYIMQRQAHLLLQILGHKLIRMALQGL